MRNVSVTVIKGTGLAAKDISGFFRKTASSDPYFIIRFKNKCYTSEYRPKTLEPQWKAPSFQIGWINEVETKAMKIEIYDYDMVGAHDFMGMIRVPGHALYHLGLGDHMFWFELSSSKERAYRNQEVSGKILVSFRIDVSRTLCIPSILSLGV